MLSIPQKAYVRHAVNREVAKLEGREVMTDKAWCEAMGLHTNTAISYKKNPEVVAAVAEQMRSVKESKDLFRSVIRRVALEEMWTRYDKAKDGSAEKRHYLKMILDETDDVEEHQEVIDYSTLCDEDLEAIIFKRELSPAGKTEKELQVLAAELKGETWIPPQSSEWASSEESLDGLDTDMPIEMDGLTETEQESSEEKPPSNSENPTSETPSSPKNTSPARRKKKGGRSKR
jgi:hypothetical protein